MLLDQEELKDGLKAIVGTWQADFLVNALSDDLRHIPASDFKSEDGRDFTALQFIFTEDHRLSLKTGGEQEYAGSWEQTDLIEYHVSIDALDEIPDKAFVERVEKMMFSDGFLCFTVGFLTIAMKKIAEGVVTKPEDVADLEGSAADQTNTAIVGTYRLKKAFGLLNGDYDLFPVSDLIADLNALKEAGEVDDDEYAETMGLYDVDVEFTGDHQMILWSPIPEGVTEEELKEALDAGEILGLKDGRLATEIKTWKCVDGRFYVDSGEAREVSGEALTSWDELTFDEDGDLLYEAGGMALTRA